MSARIVVEGRLREHVPQELQLLRNSVYGQVRRKTGKRRASVWRSGRLLVSSIDKVGWWEK